MSIAVKFDVLNTKNSPSIGADTFAARPASAAIGAIYIATDTNVMYRWNGSTWATIGGGVSGSGTINKVPVWTGSGTLGDSDLIYTTPGSYPNKLFISGASFESQFAAPTTNGQAAGWIIRRTSDNNIIGMLYGQDTTLSGTGSSNIFHHYIQDNYFIKVYSGVTNYYHSFFKNGRIVVNGYTDAGFQFDVVGDTRTTKITFNNASNGSIILDGGTSGSTTGAGGTTTAIGNIVIGAYAGSNLSGSANNSMVLIGNGAGLGMTTGGLNSIQIGRNAGRGITTGTNNIILTATDATNLPSTLSNSIHILSQGYELNDAAKMTGNATSSVFIGGGYNSGNYVNSFYFGAGGFVTTPASANLNFYAPSGTGTDLVGANFTINAGRGTGAGQAGDFIIATSTNLTTGTTLQTLSSRWFVKGNTGILSNQSSTNASALIDLYSTTQGLGVMAMTTTQKNAIASPRAGILVYDTTALKMCFWDGTAWRTITSV